MITSQYKTIIAHYKALRAGGDISVAATKDLQDAHLLYNEQKVLEQGTSDVQEYIDELNTLLYNE